ncbi:MAG: hypothetical protein VX089_04065 [Pseudomonadota bacterium]|nr:hypothetical protein [Pseudomonadota bacterium]
MIVGCLGYGYIASFLFKELSANGIKCLGVTNKKEILESPLTEGVSILPRKMTKEVINSSTHLIITAPPRKSICPILSKYNTIIKKANIRSIVYISTTGVYGNHNGKWVSEKSHYEGKMNKLIKNRIGAEKAWVKFAKKLFITLNVLRLGGIYGPERPKLDRKLYENILTKKNHFFSRIHVFDISRLIVKILCNISTSGNWNIVDKQPSTREEFILRIIELKNIKTYNFIDYKENKVLLTEARKRFWEANKKVSSKKAIEELHYSYLFPSYVSGLKHIVKNS